MDEETIRKAWENCEVEELERLDGSRIDPAVFKPLVEGDFVFNGRLDDETPLWDAVCDMDAISCMMEPLDGFLRCTAYVYSDDGAEKISIKTYSDRVKLSPGETECSFEAFTKFIQEWEENVCELEFLGGLEAMEDR
jgi:hypothetical protein